ncbi:hypothetical protein [Bosea sp. 685]|uniref:hypothetical protein n=1 Tax=Bosea sp. 685 TaxID=3080057 RepID=UPI002892C43E|nr:hypothetical protein [Bosea sp. 685]WNJ91336.1 hypothetical protein RMR04_03255 [Bosea sp. 685]
MVFRSTAPSRLVLTSLAVAGALAGSVGGAAAQYYLYEEEEAYPRGYYERYAPLPPAPVPPRSIGRIAARDFGLARVDRMVRTGSSYVIDGQTANGGRARLIFDAHSGDLVDRIPLPDARPRPAPAPHIARVDPRDDRPAPRLVPRPPERPPSLKPQGQASAPATILPPSPAAPPHAAEPLNPAEKPAATASAPATIAPSSPAAPALPTPGPANPATGADKPQLVNPQLVNPNDVRGTDEAERKPPLARADPSGITVAPVELPPVQIQDATPSTPKPETPAVPVAPLD